MIPDFNMELDGTNYDVLGYVDTGSGYDWAVTALLRRQEDGALFLASDSGCSCNYFGDSYSNPIDKQVYSVEEALREVGSLRSDLERSITTMSREYV